MEFRTKYHDSARIRILRICVIKASKFGRGRAYHHNRNLFMPLCFRKSNCKEPNPVAEITRRAASFYGDKV